MNRFKKILKAIATFFLVVLVLLCVYTFVVTDIMKKDYVNVFGYTYFVVASGSMSGSIEVDDIIFVRITKDVKENEIITFLDDDGNLLSDSCMMNAIDNIAGWIKNGDKVFCSLENAIKPLYIAEALERSYNSGRAVKVNYE